MDELKELDLAWESFCNNSGFDDNANNVDSHITNTDDLNKNSISVPKSSPIYISTKTQIGFLNQPIDLMDVFWKIDILPYHLHKQGVVKKQMKFNSITQEDLDILNEKIKNEKCVDNHIISRIVNPEGRIKFKDVRKISIGLSNKDITSYRRKKRGAFYNCFVVIMRLNIDEKFKEIHIKVFNTGKLEIPGIQHDRILFKALDSLIEFLKPLLDTEIPLDYNKTGTETVLINSNFRCGYFINRDKLYKILRYKYKINCAFDPCSYPGIQCDFYYDNTSEVQTGQQPLIGLKKDHDPNSIVKVSFMVFRTGSILIVGKCTEDILHKIYEFLANLLHNEYSEISGINKQKAVEQTKRKKVKKIIILVE